MFWFSFERKQRTGMYIFRIQFLLNISITCHFFRLVCVRMCVHSDKTWDCCMGHMADDGRFIKHLQKNRSMTFFRFLNERRKGKNVLAFRPARNSRNWQVFIRLHFLVIVHCCCSVVAFFGISILFSSFFDSCCSPDSFPPSYFASINIWDASSYQLQLHLKNAKMNDALLYPDFAIDQGMQCARVCVQ